MKETYFTHENLENQARELFERVAESRQGIERTDDAETEIRILEALPRPPHVANVIAVHTRLHQ